MRCSTQLESQSQQQEPKQYEMISSTLASLAQLNVKPLEIPSRGSLKLPVASQDGMHPYFEGDIVKTLDVPAGWALHFDVVSGMRQFGELEEATSEDERNLWEDFRGFVRLALSVTEACSRYGELCNERLEKSFLPFPGGAIGDGQALGDSPQVVKLLLADQAATQWNEHIFQARNTLERQYLQFLTYHEGRTIKRRLLKYFESYKGLGDAGVGQLWWKDTVERLQSAVDRHLSFPVTFHQWLRTVRRQMDLGDTLQIYVNEITCNWRWLGGYSLKTNLALGFEVRDDGIKSFGQDCERGVIFASRDLVKAVMNRLKGRTTFY